MILVSPHSCRCCWPWAFAVPRPSSRWSTVARALGPTARRRRWRCLESPRNLRNPHPPRPRKGWKNDGKTIEKNAKQSKHLTFWENCKIQPQHWENYGKKHVFLGTWLKKHGKTCFWGEIAAKNVNMGLKWLEKWWKFEKRTWRTHMFSETCGNHGSCDKVGWRQNLFLACT